MNLTLTLSLFFLNLGSPAKALVPAEISIPESISGKLKSFEPSGAAYLSDLDSFLIISDDTNKKDEPLLFLMNQDGEIEKSLKVRGLKKMTDMESISQDDSGNLYILSSQGLNKNGDEKDERNLFVRASRSGENIETSDSVYLRPLLLETLEGHEAPLIEAIAENLEDKLDVESHFVRRGELFLGLKEPQPSPGVALILKAGSVDAIFSGEELQLEVFKAINFKAVSGEDDLLSDLMVLGEKLYMTTTQENGVGRLWSYDEKTEKLTVLEEFNDLRPEGLAFDSAREHILVVFDEADEAPLFAVGAVKE